MLAYEEQIDNQKPIKKAKESNQTIFKNKLQQPESAKIKQKMLEFLKKCNDSRLNQLELIQTISEFIHDFEIQYKKLWSEPEDSEVGEAIEGIVTKALYDKLVSHYSVDQDLKLEFTMRLFGFVELEHFECKNELLIETSFKHAISHISKIDEYRTPKDKLISIINCCKIISKGMVYTANKEKATGADDFLPILIYTILKALPKNPFSNIQFIKDYRPEHKRKGQDEYYFTAYQSAIEFIESLDMSKLKIEETLYKKLHQQYWESSKQEMEGDSRLQRSIEDSNKSLSFSDESKTVESDQHELVAQNLVNLKQQVTQFTSKFMSNFNQDQIKKLQFYDKPYESITVPQVQELHSEYKKLVSTVQDMRKNLEQLEKFSKELDEKKKKKFLWWL